MSHELEFPPIDAPATPAALTEPAAGAVQLAKLDLQAVALASFEPARAEAKKAKETLADVVHDLSTSTKLAEAKSLRQRLINTPLAEARKVSAGLKAKLTAVSKAVGTELASIEAEFSAADALITPQIEKREAELAEERRIAAEKEAARVKGHADNIAKLADYAERARGLPAARIRNGIAIVEAIEIVRAAWEEFADRAEEQKAVTLERMRRELAAAEALEAEALRLAEARADLERQREELEARRVAAERLIKEAAEQAEQKLAAEKAAHQAEVQNQAFRARLDSMAVATEQAMAAAVTTGTGLATPKGEVFNAIQVSKESEPATLTMTAIARRLGFAVSADLLESLGLTATRQGAAKLYRESDWPRICDALVAHIQDVREPLAVAA